MTAPARNLDSADTQTSLEVQTAATLARLARAAGVQVTEAELRAAVSGMSPEALARLPASYARDLADAAAMGLDLNDPALDAPTFTGTADEAIRFIERSRGACAPSR
jgi:hypothetical protein